MCEQGQDNGQDGQDGRSSSEDEDEEAGEHSGQQGDDERELSDNEPSDNDHASTSAGVNANGTGSRPRQVRGYNVVCGRRRTHDSNPFR